MSYVFALHFHKANLDPVISCIWGGVGFSWSCHSILVERLLQRLTKGGHSLVEWDFVALLDCLVGKKPLVFFPLLTRKMKCIFFGIRLDFQLFLWIFVKVFWTYNIWNNSS